ncbi:MAG: AMP-binding protein [Pseudomonadota bacterium]
MTILAAFTEAVARHPDRAAIIDGKGHATTYAELDALSAALAQAWAAKGIGAGDAVLIATPVDARLYAALAALWRLGAMAVLPEPAMGLKGVRNALAAQPVKAWIGAGALRVLPVLVPRLLRIRRLPLAARASVPAQAPAAWPDAHPALMSFTSGSTGRPKAIVRTHGFLKAQNAAVSPMLASDAPQIDLVGFPVFVLANIALGVTSVLPNWPLRRIDKASAPAIRALCEAHGVTRLLLPPALVALLADGRLPPALSTLFTGGGPVFPDVVERLLSANPKLDVIAVYGSTEAEPVAECRMSALEPEDRAAMASGGGLLAGHPAAATNVRIVEDEIQVTGGHVVQGYVDPADDARTKVRDADGTIWHRTGDGGRLDEAGRLWLRGRMAGRVDDLWPFEIEVAARCWSGVRAAALCPIGGKAVLAIEGEVSELGVWCHAAQKLGVDEVVLLDTMPMDARHGSKIDYGALTRRMESSR